MIRDSSIRDDDIKRIKISSINSYRKKNSSFMILVAKHIDFIFVRHHSLSTVSRLAKYAELARLFRPGLSDRTTDNFFAAQ